MATNPFQLDLRRMALGILYINIGRADVVFPTTTRAHPSYMVQVTLIPPLGLLDEAHKVYFPFFVKWDIWQNVIVPLFRDGSGLVKIESGSLRNEINREYLLTGDHEALLTKISQLVLASLIEQNYVPAGATPAGFVPTPAAPGEPVVPPGTTDGSPYQRFD